MYVGIYVHRDADASSLLTVCTFEIIGVGFQWVLFGGVEYGGARPMERRRRERKYVRRWLLLLNKQRASIAVKPTTRW